MKTSRTKVPRILRLKRYANNVHSNLSTFADVRLAVAALSFYLCASEILGERPVPMRLWKALFTAVITAMICAFCGAASLRAQQKTQVQKIRPATPKVAEKLNALTPLDAAINALFAARTFEQCAISPDGKKIAWVENLVGKDGFPDGNTAIYLSDRDAAAPPKKISAALTSQFRMEGNVAWSPDSTQLAFLSDAVKPGQLQLYVVNAAGGPAKKLTNVKGLLATPGWSPDGKRIALLFTENAIRAAGPLVAEAPETGEIKDSYFEQRLAVLDLASGEFRQISPADMYVYEYDWSPDSQRFAITAARGNGDDNWYIAQLYSLDAGPLGMMKPVYKPPLQIANPAWSPDGKSIAFIAGLMSDEPSVGGDIFTVPAIGGDAINVTPEMKATANWLAWTAEAKILFAGSVEGGDAQVATVDPSSHQISQLWRGSEQLSGGLWGTNLSLSADGKTSAVIRSSFSDPPEIWAGGIGYWRQVTQRNASVKPGWGEAKSIHWKSDGYDVQGWLTYPKDFDASKEYPMVVHVHGGPGAAVQSEWPRSFDFLLSLAGAGYFVFTPNPRGSFGQGEAFTQANVRDFATAIFATFLPVSTKRCAARPLTPSASVSPGGATAAT